MLDVTRLFVRSFNLDHLDVFWEISPVAAPRNDAETHQIFDYNFTVLRSEAAMGPYDVVGGPFRDIYRFRDVTVSLLHKWRQHFYKIRVTHVPSGEVQDFGPSSHLEPEGDLIAAEVIRQEDVLFREFVGRRCFLFPARTFGPRCSCFDKTTGKVTRSNHGPCFGTGWLGGYMSPVEVWVQVDPHGKTSQTQTVARMGNFPPVSPRDILIESENRRWKVMTVSTTERLRAKVRQELQVAEIVRGDIEYALPVNVDLSSLKPSAERNFTNPQTINDDDFSDILAAYGHPRGVLR